MAVKPVPTLIAVALTLIIWFAVPVPQGIDPGGWHLPAGWAVCGILYKEHDVRSRHVS